jgi:transcriptional regulator with XRE-family HTH domain
MNRRLLQFLQAENITQTQLADTLSVARGSVSNILAGRNKPGYDFLESLILHYPNLNLEWLVSGKGKMYHEPEAASSSQEAPQQDEPVQLDLFSIPTGGLQPQREISKIMVFFSDKTFQEFRQSE